MILITNYARNFSQKLIKSFSFMFFANCFKNIHNIYPDEEQCKYANANRLVYY